MSYNAASALLDTSPSAGDTLLLSPPPLPSRHAGDLLSASGVTWDASDIARFLDYTEENSDGCLIWTGTKSRGRGNTAWYGSFKPTAHRYPMRAHKFYAVAVLGHRPKPDIHHLDHTCQNSLCVRHIDCVPAIVNLKLRWIRAQVGLDELPDYEDNVRSRMARWLEEKGRSFFEPEDADRLWKQYLATNTFDGKPEHLFLPDRYDPRFL